MAFSDLRPKSAVLQRFLRSDWTEQEKKFHDNITHYLSAIAVGNPEIHGKKLEGQPVGTQGVAVSRENPSKKEEGVAPARCVELTAANAKSVKAERPTIPMTPTTPTNDLEDFFAPSSKPAKQEEKPKAPEADPFDFAPAEQTKWVPPEPKTPTSSPSTSLDSEIASQMAAVREEVKTSKKKSEPEPEKSQDKPQEKPLDGFDFGEFKEVQDVISNILAKVKRSDIDSIVKMIPQFAVHMKLDRFAETPAVISQAIVEVQHQLDSVHDQLMDTGPESQALGGAWDYLGDVGMAYSTASNREKRMAQAKIVMRDLWKRYIEVKTVHAALEKTYRHLQIQFDTLSRLITCEQERRAREIGRGPLPFDGPYQRVPEAPAAPVPQPAPEPQRTAGENAALAEKYASLDSFPKGVKATRKDKEEKGLIGGDDLNF
jgi:hypothetical protein